MGKVNFIFCVARFDFRFNKYREIVFIGKQRRKYNKLHKKRCIDWGTGTTEGLNVHNIA
jgi:hypothetical protein